MHYDHRAVGGEPLGHIVENRVIRRALLRRMAELAGGALEVAAPDQPARIERRAEAVEVRLASGGAFAPACSPPPTAERRPCATSPASA